MLTAPHPYASHVARLFLIIGMCFGVPHGQLRVLKGRATAQVQKATHTQDGAPDHDWRQPGAGTTRAMAASAERPALALPPPTAMAAAGQASYSIAELTSSPRSFTRPLSPPLRI